MNTQPIFDVIIRQTIQLSALIVIVGVVTKLLCGRRPHVAHVLWTLVLVKAVTPPVWSSPMGVFSWAGMERWGETRPAAVSTTVSKETREIAADRTFVPTSSTPAFIRVEPQKAMPVLPVGVGAEPMLTTRTEVARSDTFLVVRLVGILWGVGVAGTLGVLAVRWNTLRRRIAGWAVPPPAGLVGTVRDVCRELGVYSRVRTILCRESIGPAVVGFMRPTLVLPTAVWDRASRRELRHILAHEIVHVRRRDPLISALQALVQAIWWFHPLVWWMNRRINEVREVCCDAEVIAGQRCEPEGYAQMLIDVARMRRGHAWIEPVLGVSGAAVTKRRLEYIMNEAGQMAIRRRWIDWMLFAVCALVLLPGAGLVRGANTNTTAITTPPTTTPPSTQPSAVTPSFAPVAINPRTAAVKKRIDDLQMEIARLAQEGQTSASEQMQAMELQLKSLQDESAAFAAKDYFRSLRANESRVRHFVMIVVGMSEITFQGQSTTMDLLPGRLLDVPDAPHTVVQLAYASGDVTMRRFSEVQGRVGEMVKRLGFEYLSLAGEHSADSKGSADQEVSANAVITTSPDGTITVQDGKIAFSADHVATTSGFSALSDAAGPAWPSLTPAPPSELTHVVPFQLGHSDLQDGDSITITEVRGTSDQFQVDGTYQVKGTYRLASVEKATLALSIAASYPYSRGSWGRLQSIEVNRGTGTFTLTERMICQGAPHVSLYANGKSGGVYFGTGDWVER